jgi:hypothetical protein
MLHHLQTTLLVQDEEPWDSRHDLISDQQDQLRIPNLAKLLPDMLQGVVVEWATLLAVRES